MTATEHHQLLVEARRLPDGIHRDKILAQLERSGPQFNERPHADHSDYEGRQGPDPFSARRSLGNGSLLATENRQPTHSPVTFAPVQPPEPAAPRPPSEQECVERLAKGDSELSDILVSAYGWERVAITRKLIVMLPPGNGRFFVLPVEREFVMGAFDEILATILFDHVPGQLRYVCERPCIVDRTGFAVERLKDADYWRTRELTRGTLV